MFLYYTTSVMISCNTFGILGKEISYTQEYNNDGDVVDGDNNRLLQMFVRCC